MSQLFFYIDSLIAKGAEFQLGLRGQTSPIGPGKVEVLEIEGVAGTRFYRMMVPAQMQANKHVRPADVFLPIVFDPDDVVMVIEAPINRDGDKLVVTPGNGRTAGGLHIPGAG